jgi:periplasmic divalent cation tolerance protein
VSERLLVLTTVARAEDAERIAEALVEERLAACVNVLPGVRSIYRWKGAVEREEERLLVVKTRADRFAALRDRVLALHPYEVPEVVAVAIEAGSPAYLRWLDESVGEGT